jgi:adenine-specific DNA methylase
MLLYADDVNLLDDNTDTTKKNTQTLIDASKEVGLEVNTEKTKYMLLSRHQNAGQNPNIKIANILRKCGTVEMFGNDYNKSKPDSGGS